MELSEIEVRFMSVTAASKWAGLSPSTLRRWLAEGRLPAHRPPGTRLVLIDRNELLSAVMGEPVASEPNLSA